MLANDFHLSFWSREEGKNIPHGALPDIVNHSIKHIRTLNPIFGQRIALRIGIQRNTGFQILHRFQLIDPFQIHIPKKLDTVKLPGKTGVEMEALTGVSVALLTIYDMCKAMDKSMELTGIHLVHKEGGKSGVYDREE